MKREDAKSRPYVDFKGFKAALQKFKVDSMQDFMDDPDQFHETCENLFRNMCEGSVANVRTESFGGSFANTSGFQDSIPDEDEPT